jgi:hypothetical protein
VPSVVGQVADLPLWRSGQVSSLPLCKARQVSDLPYDEESLNYEHIARRLSPMVPEPHPNRRQLAAYARARRRQSAAEVIAHHLERCPDCEATVASFEKQGESLLAMFRRVPPYAWIAGCCAAVVIVLGVVVYVATGKGTVRIELSDPNAKVEMRIDGQQIDTVGLKEPLRFSVGQHALEVTSGEFMTITNEFTIRRGEQSILKVHLVPKTRQSDDFGKSAAGRGAGR